MKKGAASAPFHYVFASPRGSSFKTKKNYGKRDEVGQGGIKKRSATSSVGFAQKEKARDMRIEKEKRDK